MLKDQAKSIHKLECIQIDLTFKRVKGNINEFEINSYNSKHKLSKLFDIYFYFYILQNLILYYLFLYTVPFYAHIYTNVTTAEGYQHLFTDLFNVVKNLTGQAVKFKHIDGGGIGCIVGDLDPAQAKGLGLFLHSKDSYRDWETHLKHIFKSCVVHFER